MARGAGFLVAQQSEDGALRSRTHRDLASGHALTALALFALSGCPEAVRAAHRPAIDKAFDFLATVTETSGAVGGAENRHPAYTSAFCLLALTRLKPEGWLGRATAHVELLLACQLTAANGFAESDPRFGGFAGQGPPRRGEAPPAPDISVTSWALEALHHGGLPPEHPVFAAARGFVERCRQRAAFVDHPAGAFFFTTTPVEAASKAGFAGKPALGNAIGYGTATCDALAALLCCDAGQMRGESDLALRWIADTVGTPALVPGLGGAAAQSLRYYWLAAVARVTIDDRIDAAALAWLLPRQQGDGSWRGEHGYDEDEPLVATSLALMALQRD
jgi:hypothetical protein